MNVLKTARVVVVDDDQNEASTLVLALARLGIGAWHFNGDEDQLPIRPLEGVRLVFLDLRLASNGPSMELKQVLPHTLAVLERIVGESKGAVGIVYWTKNEEDIEEFEKRLGEDLPKFKASFIQRIEDKLDFVERATTAEGLTALSDHLKKLHPPSGARLLLEWEQAVHDAASATTNLLAAVSNGGGNEALQKVLGALVSCTGASEGIDASRAVSKLFEALNPIQFDQLEQLSVQRKSSGDHADALLQEVSSGGTLLDGVMETINSILLTARCSDGDPDFQPGAVFVRNRTLGIRCPHHHCDLRNDALCQEMLKLEDDTEIKALRKQARENTQEGPKLEIDISNRKEVLAKSCRAVLVEVTPACDFSNKRSTTRFVGGLLIPEEFVKLIKKPAQFIKEIELMTIPELGGNWKLAINSRYVFGVTFPLERLQSRPLFRLRSPVVVDVLAWLAGQSSRPGYMSLRKN
jgi:hypothetical protein